ncbi:SURF1 family protein [Pseudazoarcus pumilus]|uniref:SURF1-like protein n=2 Tax=Pseudazoarcus pumilus TaxID=2067960 RepID=A0A2I6S5P6_9RHOO|nr:SURF1 family protein [Pseudazoarcus pumilus]
MFRPFGMHPVPLLAGVVVVIVAVQLGNWQLRRAEEKREIGVRIEQYAGATPQVLDSARGVQPPEWSRVVVRGRWLPEAAMYLDNRVLDRRPGYHVLMPLELTDASVVMVNRGWTAAGSDRAILPEVDTSGDEVEVVGRVVVPERDPFSLADQARDGQRWQFIDLDAYRAWSALSPGDWVLQQESEAADGLVRRWADPDLGEDTHRGYALQWYSLAALAAALTGYYVFRSFRKNAA